MHYIITGCDGELGGRVAEMYCPVSHQEITPGRRFRGAEMIWLPMKAALQKGCSVDQTIIWENIRISIGAVHKLSVYSPQRMILISGKTVFQDCFFTGLIYFQNRSGL